MRNEIKKYYIENLGSFAPLDDTDFNELCSLELNFLQVPCVLYVKPGYRYTGNEILLSHKELKSILESTTNHSAN
jgi:hypothetical protein